MKRSSRKHSARVAAVGFACVVFANVLWSFVPLVAKVALRSIDAVTLSSVRLLLTVIGFIGISLVMRERLRMRARDILWVILGGVGMGANYVLYIMGIKYTTASAANVVVQVEVISLIVLSALFLRERMTRARVAGILLTLFGVGIVLWDGNTLGAIFSSSKFIGNLLVFLSGPAWGLYGLSQKVLADRGVSPVSSLVWVFAVALVVSGIPSIFYHHVSGPVGVSTVLSVMALAFLCTVLGYILIAKSFEKLDASTVASTTSILPVFTIINAHFLLNEEVTGVILLGAALVIAGILTVARADSNVALERA